MTSSRCICKYRLGSPVTRSCGQNLVLCCDQRTCCCRQLSSVSGSFCTLSRQNCSSCWLSKWQLSSASAAAVQQVRQSDTSLHIQCNNTMLEPLNTLAVPRTEHVHLSLRSVSVCNKIHACNKRHTREVIHPLASLSSVCTDHARFSRLQPDLCRIL